MQWSVCGLRVREREPTNEGARIDALCGLEQLTEVVQVHFDNGSRGILGCLFCHNCAAEGGDTRGVSWTRLYTWSRNAVPVPGLRLRKKLLMVTMSLEADSVMLPRMSAATVTKRENDRIFSTTLRMGRLSASAKQTWQEEGRWHNLGVGNELQMQRAGTRAVVVPVPQAGLAHHRS